MDSPGGMILTEETKELIRARLGLVNRSKVMRSYGDSLGKQKNSPYREPEKSGIMRKSDVLSD
jgi:hypothetical protein